MNLLINNIKANVATAGKGFDSSQPVILFLHGSGLDHRSWNSVTPWFVNNGYSVLVPDFPGHHLSEGEAHLSIEQSATWLIDLLKDVGAKDIHIVGHSQGFLSALELILEVQKSQNSFAIKSLVGVATAATISVNSMLIETAIDDPIKAAGLMAQWGFGLEIQKQGCAKNREIINACRDVMSANPLAQDLKCCAEYVRGEQATSEISLPCLMILSEQDKMTPLKSGLQATKLLKAERLVLENVGHMLPIEAPEKVVTALREFIVGL